jgi:hypothetical protein
MTGIKTKPGREQRLAAKLRENLKRRKQQARSRADATDRNKAQDADEKPGLTDSRK